MSVMVEPLALAIQSTTIDVAREQQRQVAKAERAAREERKRQGKIIVYGTCWWYSLCNFQYRSLYENTCLYNFEG
jgi:hypothetical protein